MISVMLMIVYNVPIHHANQTNQSAETRNVIFNSLYPFEHDLYDFRDAHDCVQRPSTSH